MIFRIPRLIEHVSSIMTLEEGDLVLTGTPSGVGAVVPGDKVECLLADETGETLATLEFDAVLRQGNYEFQPWNPLQWLYLLTHTLGSKMLESEMDT